MLDDHEMPEIEIEVPHFVKVYCQNRTTQYIKYLNQIQLKKAYRNKDLTVKPLDNLDDLTRCLITQRVMPLTVLNNPMLLYAAELEYRTWRVDIPISVQEARWLLQDSYPQTNIGSHDPLSSMILIQKRKGASSLTIEEIQDIVEYRKEQRIHGKKAICYA